jgi:hypothetical protein
MSGKFLQRYNESVKLLLEKNYYYKTPESIEQLIKDFYLFQKLSSEKLENTFTNGGIGINDTTIYSYNEIKEQIANEAKKHLMDSILFVVNYNYTKYLRNVNNYSPKELKKKLKMHLGDKYKKYISQIALAFGGGDFFDDSNTDANDEFPNERDRSKRVYSTLLSTGKSKKELMDMLADIYEEFDTKNVDKHGLLIDRWYKLYDMKDTDELFTEIVDLLNDVNFDNLVIYKLEKFYSQDYGDKSWLRDIGKISKIKGSPWEMWNIASPSLKRMFLEIFKGLGYGTVEDMLKKISKYGFQSLSSFIEYKTDYERFRSTSSRYYKTPYYDFLDEITTDLSDWEFESEDMENMTDKEVKDLYQRIYDKKSIFDGKYSMLPYNKITLYSEIYKKVSTKVQNIELKAFSTSSSHDDSSKQDPNGFNLKASSNLELYTNPWENGTLEGFTWAGYKGQHFTGDHFYMGKWLQGTFRGNSFESSVWNTGRFRGNEFTNSTWKYGKFFKGVFMYSEWMGGLFYNGTFIDSTWRGGEFHRGKFIDSTWDGGDWYQGTWVSGTWKGGRIWDSEKQDLVKSDVSPPEFYKQKKEPSNDENDKNDGNDLSPRKLDKIVKNIWGDLGDYNES